MNLTEQQLERYARHIILKEVGGVGQARLLNSHVLMVGAGGLGCPVLQYLASAGVGHITIMDGDVVSLSNLQRQTLHDNERIGMNKAESAKKSLARINPDCQVTTIPEMLNDSNFNQVDKQIGLIIDGSDNFETRFLTNKISLQQSIPLVSAALYQFEGQVMTMRPDKKDQNGNPYACYQCLVSRDPEMEERSCAEQGILGSVAGIIGAIQATEALKELLGIGTSLAGHLFLFDALNWETRRIRLPKDPHCPACGDKK